MASTDPLYASLNGAVAAELRRMSALIEELAGTLLEDEHFLLNHVEQMQLFDMLAQSAGEAAGVLDRLAGGADPHAAVAGVRLGAVQARLRSRLVEVA